MASPQGSRSISARRVSIQDTAAESSGPPKLPPPYDDVFRTDLWPTIPDSLMTPAERMADAKTDVMMAYLQDVRHDVSALKGAQGGVGRSKSVGSRRSSGAASAGGANIVFTQGVDDEGTEEAMEEAYAVALKMEASKANGAKDVTNKMEEATTLAEALPYAIRSYLAYHTKRFKTRSAGAKAAGIDFKKYLSEGATSLTEDVQRRIDQWSDDRAQLIFIDAIRRHDERTVTTATGGEAAMADTEADIDAEVESEAEASTAGSRGRQGELTGKGTAAEAGMGEGQIGDGDDAMNIDANDDEESDVGNKRKRTSAGASTTRETKKPRGRGGASGKRGGKGGQTGA